MEKQDVEEFMKIAINESKKALEYGEVPIGAVIVQDGKILAKAFNRRENSQIATHHAEILAIEKACKKLKSWRLDNSDIFITLEPCYMCAGAILNARIKRVFFGAFDTNSDDKNLLYQIFKDKRLNHKCEIVGGILEDECKKILSDFFKSKRTQN
ncbi:MAG: nucleoside deaminase [Clostridia bacterium]|jgi:tRNA(adenine34) deaminase|nr:nucleoside deaminase [Clostridia bacterium]MDD3232017.1 nucleoside deaminase [Clostridia bacterium]MDD4408430.1 nucleoside deaminase [Clostridia bacterium]